MINKSISVFFPCYDDKISIVNLIKDADSVLKEITKNYEIIVVDDGSSDGSVEVLKDLQKKYKKLKLIIHEKNKGYGSALKSGFSNATKDLIFYTDGDGQYDVKEIKVLVPFINDYDLVNGYKIKRSDPLYRTILGFLYQHFTKFLFRLNVKDVDCDFRLFNRKIIENIMPLKSEEGSICVEMMRRVKQGEFTIKNVPVHHYPRQDGVSQFFVPKRVIKTLWSIIRLWVRMIIIEKFKNERKSLTNS